MRGYSAIGLVRPKDNSNIGSALRAAYCYNVAMVAIQGQRAPVKHATDTPNAWRLSTPRGEDLFSFCPYDAIPVGIDLVEGATSLVDFKHPERAFYVFGPEDGTLGKAHLDKCKYKIMIPTKSCMNLAATVNVVLYDRLAKRGL